ncbi:MAG: ribonuclease P protein component [Candidatus Saccharimonadales bacterium]
MLSHTYRFHGHGSLRYLYRNGQVARNRHILIKYCPNTHRAHSRVAVIVGKKVLKSAVKRNRIRRRIFEIIRNHWDHIPPHFDISLTVFTAECLTMSQEDLEKTILGTLAQAHLYNKTPVSTSQPEKH